jgi:selenocysteine lyase/cysteine desulfurase
MLQSSCRGGCKITQTSPKPPVLPPCVLLLISYPHNHLATNSTICNIPVYQSNVKLFFNYYIDVNSYAQNSPEAMKDNLSSATNIIHNLLNASNRPNVMTTVGMTQIFRYL